MNVSKLQSLIDGKQFTKAKIVKETGISRPALDAILIGKDFKVSNLEKLARCFNKPVGFFFDDDKISFMQTEGDYSPISEHGNISIGQSEAVLSERIKSLEVLLKEKDVRISELKERIDELKEK